jgi:hypothetical protein
VKKMDPTKNTAASVADPTAWTNPGKGPMKKQVAPIANSTPIHHDARCGAHQTRSCLRVVESKEWCFRWSRDDHWETPPSGPR